MDVTINNKVQQWCDSHPPASKTLQTKCTEAYNDDFSTWRNISKTIYDFRAPGAGDYRIVATKGRTAFEVKAVYEHAKRGGKDKVAGETVSGY